MNADSLKIHNSTAKAHPKAICVHCSTVCDLGAVQEGGRDFCCLGCSRVYDLLHDLGLHAYYELQDTRTASPVGDFADDRYTVLEQEGIGARLLDHRQGDICRITFRIPAIHCASCVWLLESLYSLCDGIGRIEVDILRKEARVDFDASVMSLAEVARQFERFGYPPEVSLQAASSTAEKPRVDRLLLKVGIAGFAFGNTMLFHFPAYLGLDLKTDALGTLFGTASLLLSLPVMLFSASDFWRNSWRAIRYGRVSIDVPIALGLMALFAQSLVDLATRAGPGYLDSLCGLVFFLLLGKWYQRRTADALTFDRDYRSYFPLMARREQAGVEQPVMVTDLQPGDRIRVRRGELIPADSILVRGEGSIDYSFVTGESDPQRQGNGDMLYAGGRQMGTALTMDVVKPVSQSYLTSLWNDAAFESKPSRLSSMTDAASRIFTPVVLALALGTLLFHWSADPRAALVSAVAVLIVACPCALALSVPFAFGQALRILGRNRMYIRATHSAETLARVGYLFFDKTGTLTRSGLQEAEYTGLKLDAGQGAMIHALADQSTHPLCRRIVASTPSQADTPVVSDFEEVPGMGVRGVMAGQEVRLGSKAWLGQGGVEGSLSVPDRSGSVYVAIGGKGVGVYHVQAHLRPGIEKVMSSLLPRYEIGILTGDHASGAKVLEGLLPAGHLVLASQTPQDKLDAVKALQDDSRIVAMLGDGLNDVGRAVAVGVYLLQSRSNGGETHTSRTVIMNGPLNARAPRATTGQKALEYFIRSPNTISKNSVGTS